VTKRILVVEDQEDNLQILRDLLTSAGFEIIEAKDGEQGVRAAVAERVRQPQAGAIQPVKVRPK